MCWGCMHTEVNMIWLESPTGVGFSYSRLNMAANTAGRDARSGMYVQWLAFLYSPLISKQIGK
jgi:carboxypeptidase C (cathepsin A)